MPKSDKKWSKNGFPKTPKSFAISVSAPFEEKNPVFDPFLDDFWSKNGFFTFLTFLENLEIKMTKNGSIFVTFEIFRPARFTKSGKTGFSKRFQKWVKKWVILILLVTFWSGR